jgi:sortase (surface protein transpeptidase)
MLLLLRLAYMNKRAKKAKQSKAKQSKAKQSKAKQSKPVSNPASKLINILTEYSTSRIVDIWGII